MNCYLCNSDKIKFMFNYSGIDIYAEKLNLKNYVLKWYKCENCGAYINNQPEIKDNIYENKNLYDGQYDINDLKKRYLKIMNLPNEKSDNYYRVERVKTYYKKYKKMFGIKTEKCSIFDVGAGMGVFLGKFTEQNYIRTALEINPVACEHIKKTLEIPVYSESVQNLKIDKKFNLISLNKVIEHIKSPVEIMKRLHKFLEKNGIVYIELPDSLGYEMYGDKCDAFATGHYIVYNHNSLFYLLNQSNFKILMFDRILEPSGKYSLYAFARRK